MNKVNAMKMEVGEKIPFREIDKHWVNDSTYSIYLFPVSNNQLLYGTTTLSKDKVELVRLENPPIKYGQYE